MSATSPHRLSVARTLCLAVLAAFVAVLGAAPPAAEAGGSALSKARKQSISDFKKAARTAEKTFVNVVSGLSRGVTNGSTDAETAATGFGDALSFYAVTVKDEADDAAEAAADAFSAVLVDAGDDDLGGAQAGDGGHLDGFFADLQKEMDRLRKRAAKKARGFARTMGKRGGARVRMRVTLSPWTADRLVVPTAGGAGPLGERPLRLYGVVATRLSGGDVIVTAFGSADPALDNTPEPSFDVRLQGLPQLPLGEFLSGGGMPVTAGGWRVTENLGLGLAEGNRAVLFGTEPEDLGLAGLQPRRLVLAGVISIP